MANIEYQTRERLDSWLMKRYPDYSRSFLQKLCSNEKVLVDKIPQKSGYKLKGKESIKVLHDMSNSQALIPDIKLPIVYSDDNVIVVNKPAGVLSHGLSKFLGEPSVASFLRQEIIHSKPTDWKPEDLRYGIVHRLDRITSGLMICAKNKDTMRYLQKQFHDRKVTKIYIAIVKGTPKNAEAILDLPLERNPKAPATWRVGANGKPAQTRYKVIRSNVKYSYVELYPQSGRTHQLRVHMAHIGHPIVGDFLYKGSKANRLYLHAYKLSLNLPNGVRKTFTSKLPDNFAKLMNNKYE